MIPFQYNSEQNIGISDGILYRLDGPPSSKTKRLENVEKGFA